MTTSTLHLLPPASTRLLLPAPADNPTMSLLAETQASDFPPIGFNLDISLMALPLTASRFNHTSVPTFYHISDYIRDRDEFFGAAECASLVWADFRQSAKEVWSSVSAGLGSLPEDGRWISIEPEPIRKKDIYACAAALHDFVVPIQCQEENTLTASCSGQLNISGNEIARDNIPTMSAEVSKQSERSHFNSSYPEALEISTILKQIRRLWHEFSYRHNSTALAPPAHCISSLEFDFQTKELLESATRDFVRHTLKSFLLEELMRKVVDYPYWKLISECNTTVRSCTKPKTVLPLSYRIGSPTVVLNSCRRSIDILSSICPGRRKVCLENMNVNDQAFNILRYLKQIDRSETKGLPGHQPLLATICKRGSSTWPSRITLKKVA